MVTWATYGSREEISREFFCSDVAVGLVLEKISYLTVELKLQEKIRKGESIKDMIHVLEKKEEE